MTRLKTLVPLAAAFTLGVGAAQFWTGFAPAAAEAEMQRPGYLVVMGRGYDRQDLAEYAKGLPPLYEKFGGQYRAIATDVEVFEGEYAYQSIVIAEWPSLNAARAFWTSPEYEALKKKREGVGAFDVVAFEGFPTPQTVSPIAKGE
ncbi:MAG: DUF1330 domain-containing protein [Pseudomonadota bacterium]